MQCLPLDAEVSYFSIQVQN